MDENEYYDKMAEDRAMADDAAFRLQEEERQRQEQSYQMTIEELETAAAERFLTAV